MSCRSFPFSSHADLFRTHDVSEDRVVIRRVRLEHAPDEADVRDLLLRQAHLQLGVHLNEGTPSVADQPVPRWPLRMHEVPEDELEAVLLLLANIPSVEIEVSPLWTNQLVPLEQCEMHPSPSFDLVASVPLDHLMVRVCELVDLAVLTQGVVLQRRRGEEDGLLDPAPLCCSQHRFQGQHPRVLVGLRHNPSRFLEVGVHDHQLVGLQLLDRRPYVVSVITLLAA
mmetsp:Transcript_13824/g.27633  ORF Transcript_13824/g.27633 Transcript_13824/m.27633 type:complete len:226 (-) Transcript_13824:1890-2567(-)